MKLLIFITLLLFAVSGCATRSIDDYKVKIDDDLRASQIKEMEFGMFICWSFSTFYGSEWTPTLDKDASFFAATDVDTDQWARVARDAGMNYILFLTKHHDGFCLWDTETTEKKVTNSPLGIDVLAELRKSCDKYGIKLALYFSEGDWNWSGAEDGAWMKGGYNPEIKKAQLEELCTQYGPIEFFWMDHAIGDGGLSHEETVKWVHQFQPNCFVGFNTGEPAGRLNLRERGSPGEIGDTSATMYNKKAEAEYQGYLVAEFTYPFLPAYLEDGTKRSGGADWFYSLPKYDNLVHSAEKIYHDYLGAVKYGNIFSLNVGPDYHGRIRDVDVKTLQQVGRYIGCATKSEEWKLIWAEEFDGPEIDWDVWSKTPRGTSDWNDRMSDAEELYEIKDGKLILRGINNTDYPDDPSPFLTGGIWGRESQRFKIGRIDVRARFDSARGFWPAIWLMPVRDALTPDYYAEIDIMEHLNFNDYVYQVVHSTYTLDGNRTDPMNHVTADIDVNRYNVYTAEVYADSVVFLVNNLRTYAYPRVEAAGPAQFPFNEFDYYVILSAQLGGSWVGEVDPDHLPVELLIDWVRFYQKE